MESDNNKNLWMVRAGAGASLIEDFLKNNIISIGWNEVGELSSKTNSDELKRKLLLHNPNYKNGKINMTASQILKFYKEISEGETVITYNPSERLYYIGEVVGEYEFQLDDERRHNHIRKVSWLGSVDRDRLTNGTKNSLGAISAIFKLSSQATTEILSKLNSQDDIQYENDGIEEEELESIKDDIEDKSREFLKDKLVDLDWEEMQELVAGILRAMGYKTIVSPKGSDRGKDIIASPDGLGLEDPKIIVEVKHRRGSTMGSPDIRTLLGGLRPNTKALFVSTGGFTKEAKYEAERSNNPLTLIDLELLVDLIFQNYDQFDSETRTLLPLKKIYWPI